MHITKIVSPDEFCAQYIRHSLLKFDLATWLRTLYSNKAKRLQLILEAQAASANTSCIRRFGHTARSLARYNYNMFLTSSGGLPWLQVLIALPHDPTSGIKPVLFLVYSGFGMFSSKHATSACTDHLFFNLTNRQSTCQLLEKKLYLPVPCWPKHPLPWIINDSLITWCYANFMLICITLDAQTICIQVRILDLGAGKWAARSNFM